MKIFDCFAGIGGFRMAFEREGFKTVGFCEIDKYASKLYKAYYNIEGEYYATDATKIDTGELPDFDIFTGGFPCQAFSIAGKRQGFKDARGTLFFEIARICSVKNPKYIVLENVKGLLSHDNGRTFATIIEILTDIGYSIEWQVLNSKFIGVPQNRERTYIIGHLGKESGQKIFPIRKLQEVHLPTCENSPKKYMACLTTRSLRTRRTPDMGMVQTYEGKYRDFTPLERFRLQGFPDDMVKKAYEIGISDVQMEKMTGNSVTVNVVQEIAKRIKEIEVTISMLRNI